jgi:hypothetical protein
VQRETERKIRSKAFITQRCYEKQKSLETPCIDKIMERYIGIKSIFYLRIIMMGGTLMFRVVVQFANEYFGKNTS